MRKRKRDTLPLLLRVMARLGDADLYERFIPSGHKDLVVHGLWEKEGRRRSRVTVNNTWHTVDVLIHEILHDLHPEWSEGYVRRNTARLRKSLTEVQLQVIYDEFQARVIRPAPRKKRPPSLPDVPRVQSKCTTGPAPS